MRFAANQKIKIPVICFMPALLATLIFPRNTAPPPSTDPSSRGLPSYHFTIRNSPTWLATFYPPTTQSSEHCSGSGYRPCMKLTDPVGMLWPATYPLPLQAWEGYSKSFELANDPSCTVCCMRFRLDTICLRYFAAHHLSCDKMKTMISFGSNSCTTILLY